MSRRSGRERQASWPRRGVRPDLVPERFIAEALLDSFPPPDGRGLGVLLARAERARDVLPTGLRERGYEVDVLAVYRTVRTEPGAADIERVQGVVDALDVHLVVDGVELL